MEDKEVFKIAVPSTISSSKSLEKCVICQKIKDNKGDTKLTSTVKGRNVILECSAILKDNLLDGIDEENIKYHVNTCYARYVSSKRIKSNIYPVLKDLNHSHREGDWMLHLSAIRRALPLLFVLDRVNYKRWLPMYFDDCLKLEEKFPLIFQNFMEGEFVVKLTKRQASAIPMDQALESKYNKPAKSSSGVIGFTRRKDAVCKWGLIKHEKMKYSTMLRNLCGLNDEDEHSLHHDFASKRNEHDKTHVNQLVIYISQRGNPFDSKDTTLKNIATGASLSKESTSFFLNCVKNGEESYQKFVDERLDKKSSNLFDKIPKARSGNKKKKNRKLADAKKETINFVRTVDYARLRMLDVSNMLSYEITLTSFHLTKDGELRKSPKLELTRGLKNLLQNPCPAELPESPLKTVIVIDFMAYARKVPIKKMKLKTYEELFNTLWNTFSSLSNECARIDIVFDVYLHCSIKEGERSRQSKEDSIETIITSTKQQLPIEMDR